MSIVEKYDFRIFWMVTKAYL